jgi:hypothetical protein
MANLTVANEILKQLGNGRFIAMTGAKNLVGSETALTFGIMRNEKKVTHVRITLNIMDLYDVEFLACRGINCKTLETVNGVYAEDLQRTFTASTGLDTHL